MASTFREPTADELAVYEHARSAADNAYVPYSNFRVGAALRFADGEIVTGCNVENAAYSMCICAERTAFVRAIAEGRDPKSIELVTVHVDGPDGSPCGACRQFMVEFVPDATVVFYERGLLVASTVSGLLPGAFVPEALNL
ncbi:MAG: cytidine deaminase [Thermoleophilia bacterium]|nr:cytidine deaminase [Thermoleophilia bacterium]MCZ4495868.1 cytidine deaminase [Thermoleophilia bacterium]